MSLILIAYCSFVIQLFLWIMAIVCSSKSLCNYETPQENEENWSKFLILKRKIEKILGKFEFNRKQLSSWSTQTQTQTQLLALCCCFNQRGFNYHICLWQIPSSVDLLNASFQLCKRIESIAKRRVTKKDCWSMILLLYDGKSKHIEKNAQARKRRT